MVGSRDNFAFLHKNHIYEKRPSGYFFATDAFLNELPYQKKCIRGRFTKRLKVAVNTSEVLRKDFPDVYGGNYFEVILYEIDKIFNFSKLNFRGI